MPDFLIASDDAKAPVSPALRPNMPNRLGPRPLAPPLSTVWQVLHCWLNRRSPLEASPDWAATVPAAHIRAIENAAAIADFIGFSCPLEGSPEELVPAFNVIDCRRSARG